MKVRIGSFIVLFAVLFSSCKVFNPTRMLRTKVNYQYDDHKQIKEELYRIEVDDKISFSISTNEGEILVNPMTSTGSGNQDNYQRQRLNQQQYQQGGSSGYLIEYDGTVKLPIIGRCSMQGMTLREAEVFLEKKYSDYFNQPFVRLTVDNRRVFVFQGSTASVAQLINQNTTLFELLAQIGGVGDAKAHKIKLIRTKDEKTYVYAIDLSKVDNIDQGKIVLQSNDVVYITPRDRVAKEITEAVAPYLSLMATVLAILAVVK